MWEYLDVVPLPVCASVSKRCCAAGTGAVSLGCGEERHIPVHILRKLFWQRLACVAQ